MTSKQWQLAQEAALRYEEVLVPAILGPFAKALVDWADLSSAETIVDVGCGTGAATRFAAAKIGPTGMVTGVDVNPGMLEVARSLPPPTGAAIEWRQETATNLSMEDNSVDVVVCAQTLQFLADPGSALAEMRRILKNGGALYLSLWCSIKRNPYFDSLVRAIARHISADTAAGLGSAFALSDPEALQRVVRSASIADLTITVAERWLMLPPIEEFVPRHVQATPMGPGYVAAPASIQRAVIDAMTAELVAYANDRELCVPFRSQLIKICK